jgi:hypothetical protein
MEFRGGISGRLEPCLKKIDKGGSERQWQTIVAVKSIIGLTGEGDIYGRKPKSCLGRVFNFKLGRLTDNTMNTLNANGHF